MPILRLFCFMSVIYITLNTLVSESKDKIVNFVFSCSQMLHIRQMLFEYLFIHLLVLLMVKILNILLIYFFLLSDILFRVLRALYHFFDNMNFWVFNFWYGLLIWKFLLQFLSVHFVAISLKSLILIRTAMKLDLIEIILRYLPLSCLLNLYLRLMPLWYESTLNTVNLWHCSCCV